MYGDVMPLIELLAHANHLLRAAYRGATLGAREDDGQTEHVNELCKWVQGDGRGRVW